MIKKTPEGYRNLLAYQKACELQIFTNHFAANLPRTKTFMDLADQMSRSGRSGSKNTVEGWKRNTTKEYYDFLGFSIGAVEELKDDAADIATGVYPQLMGLKGKMGEKGFPSDPFILLVPAKPMSRDELDSLPFYPMPKNITPVVELFLRAKEVNYLLYKLQQSLDLKMDQENTKPAGEKFRARETQEKAADEEFNKLTKSLGLKRLENGQYVDDK